MRVTKSQQLKHSQDSWLSTPGPLPLALSAQVGISLLAQAGYKLLGSSDPPCLGLRICGTVDIQHTPLPAL